MQKAGRGRLMRDLAVSDEAASGMSEASSRIRLRSAPGKGIPLVSAEARHVQTLFFRSCTLADIKAARTRYIRTTTPRRWSVLQASVPSRQRETRDAQFCVRAVCEHLGAAASGAAFAI